MDTQADLRQLVYQTLANDAQLTELMPGGFHQWGVLETAPDIDVPYGVIKLGITNDLGFRPALFVPVQIWFHDRPGDYFEIDKAIHRTMEVLRGTKPQGIFLQFRWIETSQDLSDDMLRTITRWVRWQAVMTNRGEIQ